MMLKLYRRSDDSIEYWESWAIGAGRHMIHWGQLGTAGKTREVASRFLRPAIRTVEKEMGDRLADGFAPIDPDDHAILLIEYKIDGMGSEQDLAKRHELESRMNELLGWNGLGACDGGSIGSGTMDICNVVVDFDLAKQVIEDDLADTEFSDFTRIYREE